MHTINYYDILCINKSANQTEIVSAYYSKARIWHPDKMALCSWLPSEDKPYAEEIFKYISKAYETLSDSEKRKTYDLALMLNNAEGIDENFSYTFERLNLL